MREILFRGKRIDNGKWVYGDLQSQAIPLTSILTYEQDFGYGDLIPVDPATIGQFTSLTDKDGKKIFEGQYLYVSYNHIGFVHAEFLNGEFNVRHYDLRRCAVYDSPELLAKE